MIRQNEDLDVRAPRLRAGLVSRGSELTMLREIAIQSARVERRLSALLDLSMNPIGELLQPEDIDLDVAVSSKGELLERVAAIVARRQGLPCGPVLEALTDRERLGSTALGHGIAIPHARMKQLQQPAGAFVRTRCPLPFDAPDGQPVSNVLTLLVPANATDRHLQLMANAANMFCDRTFRVRLRNCATADEVEALIAGWPAVSAEQAPSLGSAAAQRT